jgi:hypothetical protein
MPPPAESTFVDSSGIVDSDELIVVNAASRSGDGIAGVPSDQSPMEPEVAIFDSVV